MNHQAYLSKHGYVLYKNNLSHDILCDLKDTLTARPLIDTKYIFDETSINYPIYIETTNKIYIPKSFGINKFGNCRESPGYLGKEWDHTIKFSGSLYEHQIEPANKLITACQKHGGGILSLETGMGKCHGFNTPILMFDGSIKMVQDIQEGELLMGDNSTPRKVLSLARGKDIMYDIISVKGDKYTVNQEHILCLKNIKKKPWIKIRIQNKTKRYDVQWWENNKIMSKVCNTIDEANELKETKINKHQDIVEISVKDYLQQTKIFKQYFKGYRVAVDFPEKEIPIDPYMIGFWLGSPQKDKYGYDNESLDSKVFLSSLKELNLLTNKHIPDIYKCNSRENRLRLLAGLLDSDGSLSNDKYTFNFIQKSEKLIDDIIYLCRSLGFACYKSKQIKGYWNKGEYYRINISGQTDQIPTLCPRKKANPRKQIKDVLMLGFTVKKIGYDKYYGFEIDGNKRYIMSDFTVTHNTITTLYVLSQLSAKTIIVVNKIPLMNQWISEIKKFLPDAKIGVIQGQNNVKIHDCDIVVGMLQSLSKIDYPDSLFSDFSVTIFDEVHNVSSRSFSKVLFKLTSRYLIGLSATPNRSDGCEYVFKWHLGDIVYEGKIEREGHPPIIQMLKLNSKDYREIKNDKKQIQFTSMISDLIEMESRNNFIIKTIINCTNEGRKILVLSDRRSHLKTLFNLIEENEVTFTFGLFLGGMKIVDLDKSRRCQVILATYSAFKEGISEKDLNTLLLITPKKFIGHLKNTTKNESGQLNQIVGRIFRKAHVDIVPLIIDLQDNFSVYKSQAVGRNKFYKEHFSNAKFEKSTVNLDLENSKDLRIKEDDSESDLITSCVI